MTILDARLTLFASLVLPVKPHRPVGAHSFSPGLPSAASLQPQQQVHFTCPLLPRFPCSHSISVHRRPPRRRWRRRRGLCPLRGPTSRATTTSTRCPRCPTPPRTSPPGSAPSPPTSPLLLPSPQVSPPSLNFTRNPLRIASIWQIVRFVCSDC